MKSENITPLLDHAKGPAWLLGSYASSLQKAEFKYLQHPTIFDYGRGVMALPSGTQGVPKYISDDTELAAEFPAMELPGLTGKWGRMEWSAEQKWEQEKAAAYALQEVARAWLHDEPHPTSQ
jgi:hypothetical protein